MLCVSKLGEEYTTLKESKREILWHLFQLHSNFVWGITCCFVYYTCISHLQDNIPESTLKKLKKYIDNPRFVPETVEKTSKACKSMCLWVRAMDLYAKVVKTVEPKRQR